MAVRTQVSECLPKSCTEYQCLRPTRQFPARSRDRSASKNSQSNWEVWWI